nr:MAG TPA: hypothetical protein [Microviridae sp.]
MLPSVCFIAFCSWIFHLFSILWYSIRSVEEPSGQEFMPHLYLYGFAVCRVL